MLTPMNTANTISHVQRPDITCITLAIASSPTIPKMATSSPTNAAMANAKCVYVLRMNVVRAQSSAISAVVA